MKITRTSAMTGIVHTRDINCTITQLDRYYTGEVNLQNAFPDLSPEDREFIKTGITPEEWDDMLGPEED